MTLIEETILLLQEAFSLPQEKSNDIPALPPLETLPFELPGSATMLFSVVSRNIIASGTPSFPQYPLRNGDPQRGLKALMNITLLLGETKGELQANKRDVFFFLSCLTHLISHLCLCYKKDENLRLMAFAPFIKNTLWPNAKNQYLPLLLFCKILHLVYDNAIDELDATQLLKNIPELMITADTVKEQLIKTEKMIKKRIDVMRKLMLSYLRSVISEIAYNDITLVDQKKEEFEIIKKCLLELKELSAIYQSHRADNESRTQSAIKKSLEMIEEAQHLINHPSQDIPAPLTAAASSSDHEESLAFPEERTGLLSTLNTASASEALELIIKIIERAYPKLEQEPKRNTITLEDIKALANWEKESKYPEGLSKKTLEKLFNIPIEHTLSFFETKEGMSAIAALHNMLQLLWYNIEKNKRLSPQETLLIMLWGDFTLKEIKPSLHSVFTEESIQQHAMHFPDTLERSTRTAQTIDSRYLLMSAITYLLDIAPRHMTLLQKIFPEKIGDFPARKPIEDFLKNELTGLLLGRLSQEFIEITFLDTRRVTSHLLILQKTYRQHQTSLEMHHDKFSKSMAHFDNTLLNCTNRQSIIFLRETISTSLESLSSQLRALKIPLDTVQTLIKTFNNFQKILDTLHHPYADELCFYKNRLNSCLINTERLLKDRTTLQKEIDHKVGELLIRTRLKLIDLDKEAQRQLIIRTEKRIQTDFYSLFSVLVPTISPTDFTVKTSFEAHLVTINISQTCQVEKLWLLDKELERFIGPTIGNPEELSCSHDHFFALLFLAATNNKGLHLLPLKEKHLRLWHNTAGSSLTKARAILADYIHEDSNAFLKFFANIKRHHTDFIQEIICRIENSARSDEISDFRYLILVLANINIENTAGDLAHCLQFFVMKLWAEKKYGLSPETQAEEDHLMERLSASLKQSTQAATSSNYLHSHPS